MRACRFLVSSIWSYFAGLGSACRDSVGKIHASLRGYNDIVPLKWIEYGVYGDLIIVYPYLLTEDCAFAEVKAFSNLDPKPSGCTKVGSPSLLYCSRARRVRWKQLEREALDLLVTVDLKSRTFYTPNAPFPSKVPSMIVRFMYPLMDMLRGIVGSRVRKHPETQIAEVLKNQGPGSKV